MRGRTLAFRPRIILSKRLLEFPARRVKFFSALPLPSPDNCGAAAGFHPNMLQCCDPAPFSFAECGSPPCYFFSRRRTLPGASVISALKRQSVRSRPAPRTVPRAFW